MTVSDFVSAYTVRNGINPKVLQAGITPDKFFVKEGQLGSEALIPEIEPKSFDVLYTLKDKKRSNIAELISSL